MNEYEVKPEEQEFKIEIGDNLLKAIIKIVRAVDKENSRNDNITLCPGESIKKAFGIDLVKIHKNELLELCKRIEL